MLDVSFVIPALNEQDNIPRVMSSIPQHELAAAGLSHEVIVVDNGSTDDTPGLAAQAGAQVVPQPERGYGNAYFAGFNAADGAVVITGDADCTYPFDHTLTLLRTLSEERLDFLSTNRLGRHNRRAMKTSHRYANHFLSAMSRGLFHAPFADSQSGMWVFRREVWQHLDVRSRGMAFSQEIKNEAYLRGFRCGEAPIEYRLRGGQVKLSAVTDGIGNMRQLVHHRLRSRDHPVRRLPQSRQTSSTPAVGGLTEIVASDDAAA